MGRQFQEFRGKYPQVELVALKDIDRANLPKVIKERMNDVYVDLFSVEVPSVEVVSTDLFGDKSYQMKEYVFDKSGCQATESSGYYKTVDKDREIRQIKGSFLKMSDDGSTLLSCDDEKYYVYSNHKN